MQELTQLPYIRDYAYYEWLQHKAYCAEQTVAVTPSDLAKIPLTKIENATFSFIPSFFTYTSEFPIRDIHNIATNPNAPEILLQNNQSYSIITCSAHEVLTLWITVDLWDFINFLLQVLCLSKAVHQTTITHTTFDLEQGVLFLLEKKLIKEIFMNIQNKHGNTIYLFRPLCKLINTFLYYKSFNTNTNVTINVFNKALGG